MKKKHSRKALKIIALSTAAFLVLIISAFFFFFSGWAKNKLIDKVEENTAYHLEIGSISFPGLNNIEIHAVKLWPKLSKAEFNRQNGYQSDWIIFKANHISIHGIHLKKLFIDKEYVVRKIVVREPDIYAYRDKRYQRPGYKYKPLPSALIRNLPFRLTVPLLEMKKATITYEEMPEDGKATGKIYFTNVSASCYHVSNDTAYLASTPIMSIEGKGLVLDSAKADILYTADLRKNHFTLKGNVHSFQATLLNRCLPQLAKSRIKSGMVKHLSFSFDANNEVANGTMDIDYENLALEVLSKDDTHESKIKTFVANLFIRNKDSEKQQQKIEKEIAGLIHAERIKDRFIFNYWWNALKSGIISNVLSLELPEKE